MLELTPEHEIVLLSFMCMASISYSYMVTTLNLSPPPPPPPPKLEQAKEHIIAMIRTFLYYQHELHSKFQCEI